MTDKNISIDDWNPDWDNNDDVPVWATEWTLPDDGLTPEEMETTYITMQYRGNTVGRWYYTEIKQALEDTDINKFLEEKNITDATDDDKEELKQFFTHWIEFLKISTEGLAFEPEEINEQIGEDILGEMDGEYAMLGKDANLVNEFKSKLH